LKLFEIKEPDIWKEERNYATVRTCVVFFPPKRECDIVV
jgi:hypothetical protein